MKVSIIVSVYNEEEVLHKFNEELVNYLNRFTNYDFTICFVNDGSKDNTLNILKRIVEENHQSNIKIKIVSFSRNFGHECAMLAGLDNSIADYYIFMDSDLQHPINKIEEILNSLNSSNDIILMARKKNKQAGLFKNITSKLFYIIINKLSNTSFVQNASDFFAFNNKVANVLKNDYREKIRFLRGIIQNIGFNKSIIEYEALDRQGGASHYNFKNLLTLSINSLLSFSNAPLKLGSFAGLISAFLGIIVLIYTLVTKNGAPSGYATIVILICFMFSILFILIGIIGEYIGILFTEIKNRPIYIVDEIIE